MIIKEDLDLIKPYLEDKSFLKIGKADGVFLPENKSEVKLIFKKCSENKQNLTISGAGTGTVAGRIPLNGKILATEKLKGISFCNPQKTKIKVQAGVCLAEINQYLAKHHRFLPPNPTEKSALIGSIIANDSSGSRSFKFGSIRDWVESLTIILLSGQELKITRGQKKLNSYENIFLGQKIYNPKTKNTAGYFIKENMDLIDLFIGSEGTLGLIYDAVLKTLPLPNKQISFYIFLKSEKDALLLVKDLKKQGKKIKMLKQFNQEIVSNKVKPIAIEYFDHQSLIFLKEKYPILNNFLNLSSQAKRVKAATTCIFVEQLCEDLDLTMSAWQKYLEKFELVETWCATNKKEQTFFEEFRHSLPDLVNSYLAKNNFSKLSLDFAVPNSQFKKLLNLYKKKFAEYNLYWLAFGHIGDNHLHINILPKSKQELKLAQRLAIKIAKKVRLEMQGTISAEHGIGKLKKDFLKIMFSKSEIAVFKAIKNFFDPQNFLNQGNIFD